MRRTTKFQFVIARNAKKRPTLAHALAQTWQLQTVCGLDPEKWGSRCYVSEETMRAFKAMLCKKCLYQIG